MKRPIASVGLIYLATSAAAVCLFPEVNLILCVTAAVTMIAACVFYREKKLDVLTALVPVCVALAVIAGCQFSASKLSEELGEQSCVISGEIIEMPRRQYGRWRYMVNTDRIELPGVKQNIRILLISQNALEEAKEGDRVTCEVQFVRVSGETGYSSTTSLRADGVNARAWCKPYSEHQVTEGGFRLRYIPIKIRRSVISCIRKALPERASSMLIGMLLGDTDEMDSDTVENFRATGIGHLLAVSGLHLSLLTCVLTTLLFRLRVTPKVTSVVVICFILMFMAVTGFPPSVVRAGIMHILTALAGLLPRSFDSTSALSVSILLMCLVNPWAAADIGLQLSVCSTLGLLLFSGRIYRGLSEGTRRMLARIGVLSRGNTEKRWERVSDYILRMAAATLTASLSILPLTALHFGSVPLISPLTNLLCVFAAAVFMIIGISGALIYCVPFVGWLISFPFRFGAALLCIYLDRVSGGLAGLPLSSLNASYSYVPCFFLFAMLLTACAFVMNRRLKSKMFCRRLRGVVICEIAVLLLVGMLSHEILLTGPEIIVFDANGGVCVCARNRTHAVFAETGGDAYEMSVIGETLRTRGVMKVDAVAVSDDGKGRSGNIYRLTQRYSPDYLITDADFSVKTDSVILPYESGIKNTSSALCLETFTDNQGGKWERLTCGKLSVIICPEKGNCALLPESWRGCDAAVIGKDITGISLLHVGAVIVTAKEKNAESLCGTLREKGLKHIYSTSLNGSVTLSVKKGSLRIQTEQGS